MRLLLLCLAFLFGSCHAEEPRSTPLMGYLLTHFQNPEAMTQQEMDKLQIPLGIRVKPGYQLAFVYSMDTTHAYYVEEVPAMARIIMLVKGDHFILGIYQEDQDKPLGRMHDCIEITSDGDEDHDVDE